MKTQKRNTQKICNSSDYKITWIVVICGAVGGINVVKLAPAMHSLINDFSLSLTQAGLLASIFTLLSVFTGIFIGSAMQSFGLRRVLALAMLCAFVGSSLVVFFPTMPVLLMARSLEGVGLIASMIVAPTIIVMYTNAKNRSKYLGLWGGFMPFGTSIGVFIAPLLLPIFGWPGLWMFSAIASLLALFLVFIGLPPDQEKMVCKLHIPILKDTIRTPVLISLGLVFAAHSLVFQSVLQFIPLYSQTSLELPLVVGTTVAALYCLCNFAGNISTGKLLHSGVPPHRLLIIAFTGIPVLCTALFWPGLSLWIKFVCLIMLSFFTSLTPVNAFHLAARITPTKEHTAAFTGLMIQIQGLGILIGPFSTAWAVEYFGGWEYTSVVITLVSLLTLMLLVISIRPLSKKHTIHH